MFALPHKDGATSRADRAEGDEAMTSLQVMESYVEAWRQRDPEAIAAHFTQDGVRRWEFVVPPLLDEPNRRDGPAEIVKPIRSLITAMPDLTLAIMASAGTDDGGMLEWRHAGTHTGSWDRWAPQSESPWSSAGSRSTASGATSSWKSASTSTPTCSSATGCPASGHWRTSG